MDNLEVTVSNIMGNFIGQKRVNVYVLPYQPRVTVTSCFVYTVIRYLESIYHLCINPIHRIVIYRFELAQLECTSYVLLNNCKRNITSLSLLVGTTVHEASFIRL